MKLWSEIEVRFHRRVEAQRQLSSGIRRQSFKNNTMEKSDSKDHNGSLNPFENIKSKPRRNHALNQQKG